MRLLLITVCLVGMATAAQAGPSIVGKWGQGKGGCRSSPVVIQPKGLSAGALDLFCSFKSVRRSGTTVRWTGHCFADGGSRRPETGDDGDVTAVLRGGTLTVSGLGFVLPNLKRCQ